MSPGPGKTSQRPGPGAPDPSVPKFFEEPRCPPCEGGKGRSGGRSPWSPSIQGCGGPRPGVGRSLVLPPPGVFRNCPPRPNGYGYGDSPGTPSPRSPEARCADLTPPREAARRTPSTVRPSRRSPGGCALGGGLQCGLPGRPRWCSLWTTEVSWGLQARPCRGGPQSLWATLWGKVRQVCCRESCVQAAGGDGPRDASWTEAVIPGKQERDPAGLGARAPGSAAGASISMLYDWGGGAWGGV